MLRAELADEPMHGGNLMHRATHSAMALIAENRRATLGAIASAAVVFFVCANALAWQDRPHPSAFFETRPQTGDTPMTSAASTSPGDAVNLPKQRPVTRIVFDQEAEPEIVAPPSTRAPVISLPATAPVPAPGRGVAPEQETNPIAQMQTMLASLGHYHGEIDGLTGPKTRAAVESYKTHVGLQGIDLSDEQLLTSLRNNMTITAAIPAPRPEVRPTGQNAPAMPAAPVQTAAVETMPPVNDNRLAERMMTPTAGPSTDPVIMKVQAGLRAFGRTELEIDGLNGATTQAAIREFQSIFRLPVTGEIDPAFLEKMTAVGLID